MENIIAMENREVLLNKTKSCAAIILLYGNEDINVWHQILKTISNHFNSVSALPSLQSTHLTRDAIHSKTLKES